VDGCGLLRPGEDAVELEQERIRSAIDRRSSRDAPALRAQFKPIRESDDERNMQRLLLLSLIFCLSTSSGCMVMDELDKASAMLPEAKKSKENKQEKAVDSANSGSERANALLEQSKRWWSRATSLSPTGLKSSIVSCRLSDRMRFMSRDDCLSQGGKPGSATG